MLIKYYRLAASGVSKSQSADLQGDEPDRPFQGAWSDEAN